VKIFEKLRTASLNSEFSGSYKKNSIINIWFHSNCNFRN